MKALAGLALALLAAAAAPGPPEAPRAATPTRLAPASTPVAQPGAAAQADAAPPRRGDHETPPPARPTPAAVGPMRATSALVPTPRPAGLRPARRAPQTTMATTPPQAGGATLAGDGGLCGDARLSGARVTAVKGAGACGIAQPVRLAGVAGVRIEPPVTVGCDAAAALADWVERSARPAARRTLGADLRALRAFAGYACRTRNNRPGGKLSEHAKGRAIDIGGVRLSDGREMMLLGNWTGAHGAFFREIWRGACGPFGTVLGPDANRWHQDHFHFDVARYRTGPYCK